MKVRGLRSGEASGRRQERGMTVINNIFCYIVKESIKYYLK